MPRSDRNIKRIYSSLIKHHFDESGNMCLLSGPRRVGKTRVAEHAKNLSQYFSYLNWDDTDHRRIILNGTGATASHTGLDELREEKTVIAFDEIQKYPDWKNFLKGFYDTNKDQVQIIVTGSTQLNFGTRTGDSMLGRYFHYHMHPLTIGELVNPNVSDNAIRAPRKIDDGELEVLQKYGGFPDPYLSRNRRTYNQRQRQRQNLLIKEDIRDLSRIQEIDQLEVLSLLLKEQAGQLLNYSNLSKKVRVSVDTVRRWIDTLESFFYCFRIRPYTKNVTRSLLKEPKVYLWDWSLVSDAGPAFENLVASHLLKAVDFWNDRGIDEFRLFFLRDKEKREVDFLIVRDNKPWLMIETKLSSKDGISSSLLYYRDMLKPEYCLQIIKDMPFVRKSAFQSGKTMKVPATTFLSQLV